MQKIIFTKQGLKDLKKKTEELIEGRPYAVLDLKKAREMGDLSENGYYKSARFKLSEVDRSIRRNNFLIKNAIIRIPQNTDTVAVGLKIVLTVDGEQKEYLLVGEYEADPKVGRISYLSPVGSKLMNRKVGDEVTVDVANGKKIYKIIKICTASGSRTRDLHVENVTS